MQRKTKKDRVVKAAKGKQLAKQSKKAAKQAIKKPPKKTVKMKVASIGKSGFHAVKLMKIKNKYMFTPKEKSKQDYKPEGVHTYIVFKDASGHTFAIQTTHLYEKKKQDQIDKNILLAMKLPGIKFPSGVRRGIITTDVEGKELDLSKVHAVNIRGKRGTYLTKNQAKKAIQFADRKGKKKKKP